MNATTFENALMGLHKNLVSYALMLTSQRHEAENLVHETTVKAMTVIDNYPPGSDFKMWVFNVMHDIFVQHYSGRATRVRVVDRTASAYRARMDCIGRSTLASLDGVNEVRRLTRKIAALPHDASMAYTLYAIGFHPEEIGARMKMIARRVKMLLHAAHARINSCDTVRN